MNPYQLIIDCALNHYRCEYDIKFPALVRFVNSTGRMVFERELTHAELDQAVQLTVAALLD